MVVRHAEVPFIVGLSDGLKHLIQAVYTKNGL